MRIVVLHGAPDAGPSSEGDAVSVGSVDSVEDGLRALGHEVEGLDVAGPVARVVARLEASGADLVLNLARGRRSGSPAGRAFFAALIEELGLAHAGADARVGTVCLDPVHARRAVTPLGISVVRARRVDARATRERGDLAAGFSLPLQVTPANAGAGAEATRVSSPDDLARAVADVLTRAPDGALIEERANGRDLVVGWIERDRAAPRALVPSEPAFEPWVLEGAKRAALQIADALELRGCALVRFRVDDAGNAAFRAVDPWPALDDGAELRALVGADGLKPLLEGIVAAAATRLGLAAKVAARGRKKTVRVGLAYNVKRIKPKQGGTDDAEAEFDAPTTIQAIADAIASFGHEIVRLEATPELASTLNPSDVDIVFNIAEGLRGRNRESQVPALLELLDIPYTGSEPGTLSLSLDKGLAKRVVRQAGVLTPTWMVLTTGKEKLPRDLRYPAIVKPVAEGSSKGVLEKSVAENEDEVRAAARTIIERYRQGALVEEFLPGREFTVGILGETRLKILPPMEIVFAAGAKNPIYTFDHKLEPTHDVRYEAPAKLDPALLREIERVARASFIALGCRDVARVDLRQDVQGQINFVECNPLPGLTPGWSDLCLISQSVGMSYEALIGEIMAPALRRLRAKRALQARSVER